MLESVNATSLINIKLALASRDYLSFAHHMDYPKSKKLEKMISHSFLLSLSVCLLWAGAEGDLYILILQFIFGTMVRVAVV